MRSATRGRPAARSCARAVLRRPRAALPAEARSPTPRRSVLLAPGGALLALLLSSQATANAATPPRPQRVFVAGATGATGRRVVLQLLAAGYSVTAGVRDVNKAKQLGLEAAGASLARIDLTDGEAPLEAALRGAGADAVICCASFSPSFNLGRDNAAAVDGTGTRALVDAAARAGVTTFVLVSSLLTNAPAVGQSENPNYKFLNLLGGVLDQKRGSELHLAASGLRWTVIRPGGLSDEPPSVTGAPITGPADTFLGLPGDAGRVVSRDTVASLAVAALVDPLAADKIVELVASPEAVAKDMATLFAV